MSDRGPLLPAERRADLWEALSNQALHLCLLPTEACNFRCEYCYESFQHGKMSREVATAVKRYLTRRAAEIRTLQVSWFGGEPLLARDVIEEISAHILALAAAHPFAYSADMTTNAYLLTPDSFAGLCRLGVRGYQITFDGTQAEHDKRRRLASGKPTFARIWANLAALRQSPEEFAIRVRLHLHPANLAGIPDFIDAFAARFGGDSRFSLFIRPVSCLGEASGSPFATIEHVEGIALAERFCRDCQRRGIAAATMSPADAAAICYASKLNSWVVRADGRLNKCTVALDSPSNDVGRILPDGSFALHCDLVKTWSRGIGSAALAELGCPLRDFPGGATPP
jgi:uncharacterized protein